jgi:hypothetical protein
MIGPDGSRWLHDTECDLPVWGRRLYVTPYETVEDGYHVGYQDALSRTTRDRSGDRSDAPLESVEEGPTMAQQTCVRLMSRPPEVAKD